MASIAELGTNAAAYTTTHTTFTSRQRDAESGDSGDVFESLGVKTETSAIKEAASKTKDQVLSQEDFLMLLTTQLKAQDPTKPADNNQLVTQMSQLSMVESLNSINESMDNVINTVTSSSALNATSLIGTYVYTDSNKGYFDGGNTLSWAIDAGEKMYSNIQLTIKDASTGEVVYTDTADALSGEIKFAWPGIYSPEGPVEGGEGGEVGEGGEGSDVDPDDPSSAGADGKSRANTLETNPGGESGSGEGDGGTGGVDGDGEGSGSGNGEGDGDDKPKYEYCTPGRYVLEVTGVNSSGETVSIPVKSLAMVTSVTLGKTMKDTMLTLYGAGQISFEEAEKVTL